MTKKTLSSVISLALITITSGCVGNNSSTANSSVATSAKQGSASTIFPHTLKAANQKINEVDAYSVNYNLQPGLNQFKDITPSCSNGVCANLNSELAAYYALTIFGQNQFMVPENLTSLTLNFKTNVTKDFHISDIFNDTSTAGGMVAGQIIQLDTSDCDQLVANGNTLGKSCSIKVAYRGVQTNSIANQIHFIFKWNNGQQTFDYSFKVQNYDLTGQTTPILSLFNSSNPLMLNIATAEDTTNSSLSYNYQVTNQVQLVNLGTADLTAIDGNTPTINVALGHSFDSSLNQLYYVDDLVTSCGSGALGNDGKSCFFPFMYNPVDASNTGQSGRFIFQYFNNQQTINFTRRFVLSLGDIQPQNYTINGISQSESINLFRNNYASTTLSYAIPLNNFKLYAKYEPQFDIPTVANSNRVFYGIGDYQLMDGSIVDGATLIKNLQINYDVNCFSGQFDPNYGNDLNGRSCPVTFSFNAKDPINKPYQVVLYAAYDSPIQHKHIVQQIGSVTFGGINGQATKPTGSYLKSCIDDSDSLTWNGNILNQQCKVQPEMGAATWVKASLNYAFSCQANSTVSNQNGHLVCDTPNPKPQGSYSQSCSDDPAKVAWDGMTLNQVCTVQPWMGTAYTVNSSLNYSYSCKPGATVSNQGGHLTCDN